MDKLVQLNRLKEYYESTARHEMKSDSRVVFGDGNINSKIVLIGEAPGEKEEELGKPFVGAAGKNLNEFLNILGLKREDIYITNVVKVRPYKVNPDTGRKSNRPPDRKEIMLSKDTLTRQLEIIDPELVVTLGNVPLKAILEDDSAKIGDYHGRAIDLGKYNLFPLYHPASILYNRALHETYIEDVHKLKLYIDKHNIGGNGIETGF